MLTRIFGVVLAVAASALSSNLWAATLYRTSDFQNGSIDNWSGGADPTVIPQGGPLGAGDGFMQVTATGGLGPGSNAATNNISAPWIGNFDATGVHWVLVDMMSPISSQPLEIRVVLHGSPESGTRYTSASTMPVPNDGIWRHYEFPVGEGDLVSVSGSDTYAMLFSNVEKIMLRHNPGTPTSGGTPVQAVWALDNIRLVPDVGCTELDAIVSAIATGTNNPAWDLNGDALVNQLDLDEMLAIAGRLRLDSGNPILPGDANLDGVVDGSDFGIWNSNKFTANASWCAGDFNADGSVDGSDFGIWNARKFTSSDSAAAIPEPVLAWSAIVLGLVVIRRRLNPLHNQPARRT